MELRFSCVNPSIYATHLFEYHDELQPLEEKSQPRADIELLIIADVGHSWSEM